MKVISVLLISLLWAPHVSAQGGTPGVPILRVVNADSQSSAVAVLVNNTPLPGVLEFREASTGTPLKPGRYVLSVVDPGSSQSLSAPVEVNAGNGKNITVVAAPSTTDTQHRLSPLVIESEQQPTDPDKALATFALASRGVENLNVHAGWFKIISDLRQGTYEGPKEVAPGTYKVTATEGDETVLGPIELKPEAGRSYLIVAFDPGTTTPSQRLAHEVYTTGAETTGSATGAASSGQQP